MGTHANLEVTFTAPGPIRRAGFDIRVGSNMSIALSIRAVATGEGDIKDENDAVAANNLKSSFVHFSVSVIWH